MTWLLIVLAVAVVLSPLMWFRQSPRQKLITDLRRSASALGLQVSLHRRPDAREEETRLETVCYRLPWLSDNCRQDLVIHRHSSRGWDGPAGWLWTLAQAAPEWDAVLLDVLPQLPAGVSAVVANSAGLGVIWNEREDAADLQKIATQLKKLQLYAKENCQ